MKSLSWTSILDASTTWLALAISFIWHAMTAPLAVVVLLWMPSDIFPTHTSITKLSMKLVTGVSLELKTCAKLLVVECSDGVELGWTLVSYTWVSVPQLAPQWFG